MFQTIAFLKKKAGQPEFKIRWVYDFFLGDYTMTRENVIEQKDAPAAPVEAANDPPAPLKTSTLAVERAEQYRNKKKSVDLGVVEEDAETEDAYDANEEGEEIDMTNGAVAAPKKVTLQDFELLRILGRGAFGKVVQIRKKDTGEIFAMKILKKTMVYKRKQVAHTMAERRILEAATHPFCISLKFAFQNEAKLYLVMDFCTGGELYYQMKKQKLKRYEEQTAKIIGAEIVLGLGHLHSKKFIYRDLKPENVLMHGDGHVCLSDFGLAKELDPDANDTRTMCGTPEYLGTLFDFVSFCLILLSSGSIAWKTIRNSNRLVGFWVFDV
jgi:tRNA A-37 threonylcarbamoyl transferase component Bud32